MPRLLFICYQTKNATIRHRLEGQLQDLLCHLSVYNRNMPALGAVYYNFLIVMVDTPFYFVNFTEQIVVL